MRIRQGLVLVGLVGALNGFSAGTRPVEVMPEADECAHCRMAVTELSFACELVLANGEVPKFDDLGCLVQYWKDKRLVPEKVKGAFVSDFYRRTWLPLDKAALYRSKFLTPMRYGLLAFGNPADAKRLEARYQVRPTSWEALLKGNLK